MKVQLGDMSWPEIEEVVKQPNVVILPVGATEQHGRHLPVKYDSMASAYMAEQAARKVNDEYGIRTLVLPALNYVETGGWPPFGRSSIGSIGISVDTTIRVIEEIVRSLISQGFKNVLVLNGHNENSNLIAVALRKICLDYPNAGLYAANWWHLGADVWRQITKTGRAGQGHTGEKETSVALVIDPENVALDVATKGSWRPLLADPAAGKVFYYSRVAGVRNAGVIADPTASTRETGERFIAAVVDDVVEIIVAIAKSADTAAMEDI